MTTYLYECPIHGEFEYEHSMKEKLEDCPKCKEENIDPPNKVTRLINSGVSFILTGSGWSRDNYS